MKVLILGADGYLGWPTAMHFSAKGHTVLATDNYGRRTRCKSINAEPLVEPLNLDLRAKHWREVSGKDIAVQIGDCCDYAWLKSVVAEFQPDCVVHYAEQPSAPYSMADQGKAAETLQNNLMATMNVVFAVRDAAPNAHIVKLGTMGEYGTPNIDIEEGYLTVAHKGREHTFLYPKTPGSIYHLTKVQDSDLMYFATRIWGMRITDLNQGPVYGIDTDQTMLAPELQTAFSYDDVFGTVINRFAVQAVAGYPLTVYGKGGQVRGYLHLRDTLACVELAAENPAEPGEFRVFNQFTETFSVNDIAGLIQSVGERLGYSVAVDHVDNPRKELEEHYYNPANSNLLDLGLQPHFFSFETIKPLFDFIETNKQRIDTSLFAPKVLWQTGL